MKTRQIQTRVRIILWGEISIPGQDTPCRELLEVVETVNTSAAIKEWSKWLVNVFKENHNTKNEYVNCQITLDEVREGQTK